MAEDLAAAMRKLHRAVEEASSIHGLRDEFARAQVQLEALREASRAAARHLSTMAGGTPQFARQQAILAALSSQLTAAEANRLAVFRRLSAAADRQAAAGEDVGTALKRLREEADRATPIGRLRDEFAQTQGRLERLRRASEEARYRLEGMAAGTAAHDRQRRLLSEIERQVAGAEKERMASYKKLEAAGKPSVLQRVGGVFGQAALQGGDVMKALLAEFAGPWAAMIAAVAAAKDYLGSFRFVPDMVQGVGAKINAPLVALGNAAQQGTSAMLSMAGGGFVDKFAAIGGQLSAFIEALNPAAVQVFQAAMKDLQAVVGTAVMPLFVGLTSAVPMTASALLPLAEELAPVFAEIAAAGLQLLAPMLNTFTVAVRAVIPVVQFFADAISAMVPAVQAYQMAYGALLKTLGEWVSSLFGSGNYFRNAMERLANAALMAVGALAKLGSNLGVPGAERFLRNLTAAVRAGGKTEPARDATGLGAATQGRVTGVPEFQRSLLAAAFTASSLGEPAKEPERKTEEILADALKVLEGLQNDTMTIKDAMREIAQQIVAAILGLKSPEEVWAASAEIAREHVASGRAGRDANILATGGTNALALRWLLDKLGG